MLAAACTIAFVVLAAYTLRYSAGRTTHGFIAYYAASRLLISGGLGPSVYDDGWFTKYVQDLSGTGVLEIYGPNPPTMALLALPVSLVGPSEARTTWLACSLIAFMLVSRWLVGVTRGRSDRVPALVALAVLLNPAVFSNLRTGQTYLFLFCAFAAALVCLTRGRDVVAGVLIGLAVVLKSSGLPLLVLLVIAGRFKAAAAAVLVTVAAIAVLTARTGTAIWSQYAEYVWGFLQRPTASVTALQTTRGFFRHLCIADPKWNPLPAADCGRVAQVLPLLLVGLAAAVTSTAAWKFRNESRSESWVAAGVCLSVLALPIAEEHHFVLLGIPIAIVLSQSLDRGLSPIGRALWLGFAALFFVPLEYTAFTFTSGWSAVAAYPRLYAGWLLWGLTIHEMVGHNRGMS